MAPARSPGIECSAMQGRQRDDQPLESESEVHDMDILLTVLAAIYFAPFMVAAGRVPEVMFLVLFVNLLIGWTGIGWLAAMALAVFIPASKEPMPRRCT